MSIGIDLTEVVEKIDVVDIEVVDIGVVVVGAVDSSV